jgi:hypothetical protein
MTHRPLVQASAVIGRAVILGAAFAVIWGLATGDSSVVRFVERAAIFGTASAISDAVASHRRHGKGDSSRP